MIRRQLAAMGLALALAATHSAAALQRTYIATGGSQWVVTRPDAGPAPHVAILYDNGLASPLHPMCTEMAKRGFLTWCALSNPELADSGDWMSVALEIKAAIAYLRRQPGIDAIVLYGHSGGGAAASFYQAVAENGVAFCQDPRKLSRCSNALAGLPRADAVVFPDAHPGMDVMSLRGLNPSLVVDGGRIRVDPALDPFSARNGFDPNGHSHYSPAFQKRYYAAQAAEMRRLVARALRIEAAVSAGRISDPADEQIVIPGFGIATHLDELDPSIAVTMSTARPEQLLRNDGTISVQPIHSVWTGRSPFLHFSQDIVEPAVSFLEMRAVRARDSMSDIDWCSANSDTVCNAWHIHAPVLFIASGASDFIADEERMYDGSPSRDKQYIVVEGALHPGLPCVQCETSPGQYANSMTNLFNYIARWINQRFAQRHSPTGDLHEWYVFPPTGRKVGYRLYVPSGYDGTKSVPLVVVLHGYMGNENSAFDETPPGLHGLLQREAQHHGFIVLAPAGYDGRGDYGAHLALPVHKGVHIVQDRKADDLAKADVLDVIRRVESSYRIDRHRVYLMGNSMGMTGTLYLAQQFPATWCAIAPSDGPPWPGYPVQRLRALSGAIFVNGGRDEIAPAAGNRRLAERVRAAGIDTRFVEVPNGIHASAWYFALPQIFDFFAAHRCGPAGARGTAASP